MINLCLVVIATQFSETKRRETERMQHERALRRRHSDSSSVSVSPALSTSVSVFSTGASCYSEMFRYVEHLTRRAWRRLYTAVIDLRRRRRADVGDPADELGASGRQRSRRRRRGRRKAGEKAVEVEMNSIGPRGAGATGSRRPHHVTLASPRQCAVVSCDVEAKSPGTDDLLTVTVRPASPLAPRASPEPSEVDQSCLTLNRSVSGEPRLMLPSTTSHHPVNLRWSSPTGMENVDLTGVRRSDDVDRSGKPRSASSPGLHCHHVSGTTTSCTLSLHFRRWLVLAVLNSLSPSGCIALSHTDYSSVLK